MTQPKEVKTPVSVYLDPVDIRRLRVAADQQHRKKADVCRLAIQEYLDNLGIVDPQSTAAPARERGVDAVAGTQRKRRTGR